MKQQKLNNKTTRPVEVTMILMLILCIGLLAVSVGMTYARYYEAYQEEVVFQVREPEMVLIGSVEDGQLHQVSQLEWKAEDGFSYLHFAVANGSSEADYSARDQKVQLCMIGSLGLMKDEKLPNVSVFFTTQDGVAKHVQASVTAIEKGTALYHSYGEGWLYRFYESTAEGERELNWELSGGQFSYTALTVKAEGEVSEGLSILQPLITAEPIDND